RHHLRLSPTRDNAPLLGSRTTFTIVFFFEAEYGIRARNVTGVQTCALPIFSGPGFHGRQQGGHGVEPVGALGKRATLRRDGAPRSEERRVGKQGSERWRETHQMDNSLSSDGGENRG